MDVSGGGRSCMSHELICGQLTVDIEFAEWCYPDVSFFCMSDWVVMAVNTGYLIEMEIARINKRSSDDNKEKLKE